MTIDIEEKDGTGQYRLLNDSVFNIYNVVAIVALFRELGYSKERVAELLAKVDIVKSRFDVKEVGGHRIIKQMSKDRNSLGTSRAFDYVSGRPGDKELILMMNNLSDSRPVSYTHLRAHETGRNLVCRLLLEKKKNKNTTGHKAK